ncbi:MAG: hypothetical protein H6890_03125 [Brucellaceae bacterium]|nr:hypothetical protein [Brucellaceae bacterium]
MDKIDDTLIDSLYEVAVDPARYDELLSAWQAKLESVTDPEGEFSGPVILPEELMRHFQRADQILVRMGRGNTLAPSPREAADCETRPSLVLAPNGTVLHANEAARLAFDMPERMRLADIGIDPHMVAPLARALRQLPSMAEDGVLFAAGAYDVATGQRLLMILTRCPQPDGAPVGRFTAVDLAWNENTAQTICDAFQLTPAETDIARTFVLGHSLGELAEEKNRSLQTVRTQAKSLLKKTGMRSQLDIVRLFAGLALAGRGEGEPSAAVEKGPSSIMLAVPGGRSVQVDFAGPEHGDPVILFHGMLTGTGLTAEAERLLFRHNIRLIQPWRGAYANSTPYAGHVRDAAVNAAEDAARVMDHLGLSRATIAGQLSGGLFAITFAAIHPARVTGVFNLSGPVPIVSKSQFSVMAPRQRLIAFTARYTPRVLPILLRAGIAQIDSAGIDHFIDALYAEAPWDLDVSRRPGIREILRSGYRATVRQGHKGFESDSYHVVRDWSVLWTGAEGTALFLAWLGGSGVQCRCAAPLCRQASGRRRGSARWQGPFPDPRHSGTGF